MKSDLKKQIEQLEGKINDISIIEEEYKQVTLKIKKTLEEIDEMREYLNTLRSKKLEIVERMKLIAIFIENLKK